MNIDEILLLTKAGYTKEEIKNMTPQPKPELKEEPKSEPRPNTPNSWEDFFAAMAKALESKSGEQHKPESNEEPEQKPDVLTDKQTAEFFQTIARGMAGLELPPETGDVSSMLAQRYTELTVGAKKGDK